MNEIEHFNKVMKDFAPLLDSWWPYIIGLILGILTAVRNYMAGSMCPSNQRIDDKIVIITGGTSGIGKETATELAKRGGHIILAVRNKDYGIKIANELANISNAKISIEYIDLSSLKSVQNFVNNLEVEKVDILINNAGIAFYPATKTEEGFELHFVTNYLGHFLLTQLLLPKLKASNQGRIINVTGQAHAAGRIHLDDLNLEDKFTAGEAFGQSKLALMLMTKHMSQLLKDTNVTINAVNPGLVRGTNHMKTSPINSTYSIKLIMQPWMWLLLKNPVQGAQTTVFVVVKNSLRKQSGKYFSDCEEKKPSENALDEKTAEKLYEKSMKLIKPFL